MQFFLAPVLRALHGSPRIDVPDQEAGATRQVLGLACGELAEPAFADRPRRHAVAR